MALQGYIKLADGTTRIDFDDDDIVNGSVSIAMSTCSASHFLFGTFNAAILKIGIIDDEALDHDFAGGRIVLQLVEGSTTTYLGRYYIDGTKTKRKNKQVMLTAQDGTAAFDTEISDTDKETQFTAMTALQAACLACGVALAVNDLSGFPNYQVTFTPSSKAIQTYRDLVMWVAQLLGANAICNRNGTLDIRHCRYTYNADPDYISDGSDRSDVQFSDVRTYVRYMTAYSAGQPKTYTSTATITDPQAREATLALPYNPLLDGKSETDCDTINTAILTDIGDFMQRQITAKMFGVVDFALGDLIRFMGGKIDVRRSILGVITGYTWRYRGISTLTCAAPDAVRGDNQT